MSSYIAEVQETLGQFLQDLRDGYFDVEGGDEVIDLEAVEENLEQTIRDFNEAVCEVGY